MIDIVTCPKCQGSGRELMLQAHSEDYCYGGTCPECQGIGAVSVSRLDLADCDRLAADLATARTEIERYRGVVETHRTDRDHLAEDLAAARAECARLRAGNSTQRRELEIAWAEQARLRADHDRLAALLAAAWVECERFRAERDRLIRERVVMLCDLDGDPVGLPDVIPPDIEGHYAWLDINEYPTWRYVVTKAEAIAAVRHAAGLDADAGEDK